MKKILRSAAALALAGCMMTGSVFAAAPTFTDVPATYWGHSFITKAAEKGLVSGIGNGLYGVSSKLSAAQFTTMVCNLLYKADVTAYQTANKTTEWWGPYMAVAYSKGVLKNTVAGDARTINGSWTTDMINAEVNRYDMAQIMYNVANIEKWDLPSSTDLLAAQSKIGDWSKVPSKYQTAVKTAYAKSFLSGVDSAGTFAGENHMTRAEGAVVLCKLLDAKTAADTNVIATPKFNNTTKLVNGKDATEKNVVAALTALKTEYPNNHLWNMKSTYKSVALGNGTGSDAFAFMLADKVFGNFALSAGTIQTIKPGDVVYLNTAGRHIVVTDVYKDEFAFVGCDSVGKITWNNTYDMDDLTSQDAVYTRYKGEGSYSGKEAKVLSNGKAVTAANVKALIKGFLKDEYKVGDSWKNKQYKSTVFKSSTVTGSEAFAYYLSDYVYGDLEVEDVDDFDGLRVGDVIYWDDYEEYLVVTAISKTDITCVGVENQKVYEHTLDVDELDQYDEAWTRYPSETDEDDDDDTTAAVDGKLSNGKPITAANVKALIDTFRDDKYDDGDTWKDSKTYTSTAFNKKSVSGNRAFSYYLSDYVFGKTAKVTELDDITDVRVGDVVYLSTIEEYVVIAKSTNGELTYIGSFLDEVYVDKMDVDELDVGDRVWTRYPDVNATKTLSNGKEITVANVKALIDKFRTEKYDENDKWDDSHRSKEFTSSRVYNDQAFAYYMSDYIFEGLAVTALTDFDDIREGDVVYVAYLDEYIVIIDVDGDDLTYLGVWDEVVYIDTIDVDDLDENDEAWTRYVDKVEEDTLSNGKTVTTRNVSALISTFTTTKCKVGDEWKSTKTYVPNKSGFGSRVVAGDQAFSYYFSDYVFGNLEVFDVDDLDDLRVGDVVYYGEWDEYLVVTKISSDELTLMGAYEDEVYSTKLDLDELKLDGFAYTRYPQ